MSVRVLVPASAKSVVKREKSILVIVSDKVGGLAELKAGERETL